jgi:hypothetical protein
MTTYSTDQLRELLELWDRNSQGLSEAQMSALIDWDETSAATKAKIQKMVEARRTGTRPQRLSATEEAHLRGRGLGDEVGGADETPQQPTDPSKPSLMGRLRGKRRGG